MTISEIDRKELVSVVAEALDQVMVPALEGIHKDLKGEIDKVRTDLKIEIDSVRTDLKIEIDSVRTDLKGEIAAFREENHQEHEQFSRKLNTTIKVTDRYDKRISRVEKHLGLPVLEATV
jgi:hypothetical protein